jgi:hypothetical protein
LYGIEARIDVNAGQPRAVIIAGLIEFVKRAVPIAESDADENGAMGRNIPSRGETLETPQGVARGRRVSSARA